MFTKQAACLELDVRKLLSHAEEHGASSHILSCTLAPCQAHFPYNMTNVLIPLGFLTVSDASISVLCVNIINPPV